jgi:osmotically-inducible protein OsmY
MDSATTTGTGRAAPVYFSGGHAMNFSKRLTGFLLSLFVASFLGCATASKQETTGEYIDDATVTARVKTAIYQEPTLKVAQINVETLRGEVQLSGFVNTTDAKSRAGEVAREVKGVKSVNNDLQVR